MEAELFTCFRRNNQKTVFLRPNIDYATPCVCNADLLSNQHENGQAIARWIVSVETASRWGLYKHINLHEYLYFGISCTF